MPIKKPKDLTRPEWAIEGLTLLQDDEPDHTMASVLSCYPRLQACPECQQKGVLFVIELHILGKRPELRDRCRACAVRMIRELNLPLWVSGNIFKTRRIWTSGKFAGKEQPEGLRAARASPGSSRSARPERLSWASSEKIDPKGV